MNINKLLSVLDTPLLRPVLKWFIWINYIRKGAKVDNIAYLGKLKKWYYKIDRIAFISTGAGWAYSYQFLLDEMKNISCAAYLPKEGDTVIDLGAGIGEETILFSKLTGNTGKVYSIEAHPATYQSLDFIIKDNKLVNVVLCNCAISEKNGGVRIDDNPEGYLGNSINSKPSGRNYFEVTGYTLDSFVEAHQIRKIDFLKVNIEGAEQLMIKGMDKASSILKHAAISCHDFRHENGEEEFFKTREKVVAYFKSQGFNIHLRNTGNSLLDNYVYISRQ